MGDWPDVLSAVDLPTLIKMHTINGAYLMYLEKITGSIEVGKRADLIILDRNVFKIPTEQITNTKVLMTMVDGKQVYPLTKEAPEDPKEMQERDQFSLMHWCNAIWISTSGWEKKGLFK